jgi:hypothetical protein
MQTIPKDFETFVQSEVYPHISSIINTALLNTEEKAKMISEFILKLLLSTSIKYQDEIIALHAKVNTLNKIVNELTQKN